jgi:hypothetical protein
MVTTLKLATLYPNVCADDGGDGGDGGDGDGDGDGDDCVLCIVQLNNQT